MKTNDLIQEAKESWQEKLWNILEPNTSSTVYNKVHKLFYSELTSLASSIRKDMIEKVKDYKIGGKNLPPEEQGIDDLLDDIINTLNSNN